MVGDGCSTCIPELSIDESSFVMDGIYDFFPSFYLFEAEQTWYAGHAVTFYGGRETFGDEKATWGGALHVVFRDKGIRVPDSVGGGVVKGEAAVAG